MKFFLAFFTLLLSYTGYTQGYNITVKLSPFKNQYIFLGHYAQGGRFPLVDSTLLDDKGEGQFKGANPLTGGLYIIVYPQKDKFFEFIIDKEQQFAIVADTTEQAKNKKFTNSAENDLFVQYQTDLENFRKKTEVLEQQLKSRPTDSVKIRTEQQDIRRQVAAYRKNLLAKDPESFLSTLMLLMQEPTLPEASSFPQGKYDSVAAFQYAKNQYWDGLNFYDARLLRTPANLFENKIDNYLSSWVYPQADSVIKALDYMLGYASINKEMTQFLLIKFINRYMNIKYMWEDAVFVHLYQKFIADKTYEWLNAENKKTITERAYSMMANIMGKPAQEIKLNDRNGKAHSLFSETQNSDYTIVAFWDPTCGHCKEVLPKLDSSYQQLWKNKKVAVFAVAKETDGTQKDWLSFIDTQNFSGWTHVYYSRKEQEAHITANIPSYVQLYDAFTVPVLYLLDKNKNIIGKKLTVDQINEILKQKIK